jgi:phytoene dehydrogenase-like protein
MAKNNKQYDAIIIGAGHNGLVCANYLAMQNLKVKVLERWNVVGGAAVTEEFYPGFKNSVASYTVGLLNPKIINDLDLYDNGLKIVKRKVNNFWPHKNGDFIAFPTNDNDFQKEIARFSKKDALSIKQFDKDIELIANIIREFLLKTPPNIDGGIKDLFTAATMGKEIQKLSTRYKRLITNIFTKSVDEFLSEYFEDERVKGAFAWDGVVGSYSSPHTPGSAYVLMHHAFGEGSWGHAIGGMGSITQAMTKSALRKGVEIETNASIKEVIVENQKAAGVILEDGQSLKANIVISSVNPQILFNKLVDKTYLPDDFSTAIKNYKNHSGTYRMNVALNKIPEFICINNQSRASQDHLTAGIVIGPDINYLNKAFLDAENYGWSKEPIIELLIPSTLDDTLAPKGKHVASLFCQQFNKNVDWNEENTIKASELILNTIDNYAPGFKENVIATQCLSPKGLEERFGLVGGDIFHGVLSLDQMFSMRPVIGHANYRSPITGLYMCGSGTHPGGGVTGAPGHNAAKEIIKDLKSWRGMERSFKAVIPKYD